MKTEERERLEKQKRKLEKAFRKLEKIVIDVCPVGKVKQQAMRKLAELEALAKGSLE